MTRYARILMIAASMAVATAVDSASAANICDPYGSAGTYFTGNAGDSWNDPAHWDNGVPTKKLVACIDVDVDVLYKVCEDGVDQWDQCFEDTDCTGSVCVVDVVIAGAIVVKSDAQVTILALATLQLKGLLADPSLVDGTVYVRDEGELEIVSDTTIIGCGGVIEGRCLETETSYITGDGELTIEGGHTCSEDGSSCCEDSDCTGTCTASGTPNDRDESMVIRQQVDPQCDLVNNGWVIGSGEDPMIVSGTNVSGNGWWVGEHSDTSLPNCFYEYASGLEIQTNITGAGSWLAAAAQGASMIIINASCTSPTGDVIIGTLFDVNQNFTTTGSLVMGAGSIDVADGKKAQFD